MGRKPISSLQDFVTSVSHQERVGIPYYGYDDNGQNIKDPSQVGKEKSTTNDEKEAAASPRTYADVLLSKNRISKG